MLRKFLLLMVDLSLLALATVGALLLRDNLELSPDRLAFLLPHLGVSVAVAVPVFTLFGLNRTIWRYSSLGDYVRVAGAVLALVSISVGIGFAYNRLEGIARSLPVLQVILATGMMIAVRVLVRLRHARRGLRGTKLNGDVKVVPGPETVLIVGVNRVTELYLQSVTDFAADRIRVAGLLGRREQQLGRLVHQQPILGVVEDVHDVIQNLEVHGIFLNRIVVAMNFEQLPSEAQAALLEVERSSNIRVEMLAERLGLDPEAWDAGIVRIPSKNVVDDPESQSFSLTRGALQARRGYWSAKRALDTVVALAALIVLSPVMLVVAVLVACDVGFPMIFWQQRPGLKGRPFKVLKFRTMRAAHDGRGRRIPDDERLSTIGAFLRQARLDELPQLWNVLIGDMSFVGPRPLLPVDQPTHYAARLQVRPGLTGWAQVKGGRTISAEDKAALDLWYVRNACFLLDLRVVKATIRMVLFGEQVCEASIAQAWRELRAGEPDARPAVSPRRVVGDLRWSAENDLAA